MITPDLLESFGSKYSREINNCVIMVMKDRCEIETWGFCFYFVFYDQLGTTDEIESTLSI